MAKHRMGPSPVEGFKEMCHKCCALDREILYVFGEECPVEDVAFLPPETNPLKPRPQLRLVVDNTKES